MNSSRDHRPAARSRWHRFVRWLYSPPAGTDLSLPILASVRGYPVSRVGPRRRARSSGEASTVRPQEQGA